MLNCFHDVVEPLANVWAALSSRRAKAGQKRQQATLTRMQSQVPKAPENLSTRSTTSLRRRRSLSERGALGGPPPAALKKVRGNQTECESAPLGLHT